MTSRLLCYLCQPVGSKHYARRGDLTRHIKNVHGAPSRFLCPIDKCPRSIPGAGFPRKDKLVDHLKSSRPGHSLSREDATYQASLRNQSHLRAGTKVPSLNTFNDAITNPTSAPKISSGNFIQHTELNDSSYRTTTQQPTPYNTILNEIVHYAGWHGATAYSNPAIPSGALETTAEQGSSASMSNHQTIDGSNMFDENAILSLWSFDSTYPEDAGDQATFNDVFYTHDYSDSH
jgi:hypothetical protein